MKSNRIPRCYPLAMPLGASAFFAGCCYGISRKHGFVYHSTVGFTPIGVPLLPIQLIEAGTLLVLFAVQLFLFLHRHRIGRNTVFYFFAYPAVRFVLAFFRSDAERGKLLGSSTSQWGSVQIIGILIAGITIRRHRSPMPKHRRRLPGVIHSARVGIKKDLLKNSMFFNRSSKCWSDFRRF